MVVRALGRHQTRCQRSADNGATWTEIPSFPKGATPVADPVHPTRFYVFDSDTGTVLFSKDSGLTFTKGATGLPCGRHPSSSWPPRQGAPVTCGSAPNGNGLYRSTDGGATFSKVDQLLGLVHPRPETPPTAPTTRRSTRSARRNNEDHPGRLHRSDDEAKTWTRINDDAHQWGFIGDAITGDPRVHGRVYVATNGRGVQYGDPV